MRYQRIILASIFLIILSGCLTSGMDTSTGSSSISTTNTSNTNHSGNTPSSSDSSPTSSPTPSPTPGPSPSPSPTPSPTPPPLNGWTDFTPSSDTQIVYVSNSVGNDAFSGLCPDAPISGTCGPKRTLLAGADLLRSTYPDWLLLRKGDTWNERLISGTASTDNGTWGKSGRSAAERMLIGSYGTATVRPKLQTGNSDAIDLIGGDPWHTQPHHLAIVGLHLTAAEGTTPYIGNNGQPIGIFSLGAMVDLLVEDCLVEKYHRNLIIQGREGVPTERHHGVSLRRNVILDAYNTIPTGNAANSQGLYVSGTDDLLAEENIFQQNGWRDDVPGSQPTNQNWYRRNVYLQNHNTGIVFRGNIIADTDGIQGRSGGIFRHNLFLHTAQALQFGAGMEPEANGVSGAVHGNVILDGNNLDANDPHGYGIVVGNTVNTTFDYNIIAHNVHGLDPRPIVLNWSNTNPSPQGIQNLTFDHNYIYDWGSDATPWPARAQIDFNQAWVVQNLTFTNNDFQFIDYNPAHIDQYLMWVQASTANPVSQIHGAGNRWFRNGTPGTPFYNPATTPANRTFTQFMSDIGDTTSTFTQVTYPDPSRDIASYAGTLGLPATYNAYIAAIRAQSKDNWYPNLMPTNGADNISNGPIQYIRDGFGM